MRAPAPPLSRKHLYSFARFVLLFGAATTTALLLWLSCTLVDPYEGFPVNSNVADGTIMNPKFSAVPPLGEPKENSRLMVKGKATLDAVEWERDQRAAFERTRRGTSCATVEEMGKVFAVGSEKEIPKIKNVILRHFDSHGAARVRGLPPDEFCHEGFVLGKASEAGFGNEMYKILTAAALSIMLNRSLIIGQTRGFYPFGDFVSYTNYSFSLKEVKHLWRKYDCAGKYGRSLQIRFDNFEHPAETNVLCSDWRLWKQPIIWFQGTTDAVAIQFFLKNINPGMRNAALKLFGHTSFLQSRPNVFGELLKFLVTPTTAILEAVDWVLNGTDPDIALHMRMLTNRSVRAVKVAIKCIKMALHNYGLQIAKPRVVLVSDTPSFIKDISPNLTKFADVLYFDYEMFKGSISNFSMNMKKQSTDSRLKDWGPAPRWVAFVDFFLASRAKHAVVSGANRRVGTTYAQLIAALAAANSHGMTKA